MSHREQPRRASVARTVPRSPASVPRAVGLDESGQTCLYENEADLSRTDPERTAVVVDSHPLWLDAVGRTLATVSVRVVGRATSLAEASRLIDALRPDLVVA